ncbi:MAG: hypothetical protein GY948_16985 [Alphaproteobacteria bacterium]|nr:hypothetical protein [Alphaproteobacteria bacterium]
MTSAPPAAQIYSLSEFWLDAKKSKLHPAEAALLAAVARGEPCEIAATCPEEKQTENYVRAEFLAFLARGGSTEAPVTEKGICLSGAWIERADAPGDPDGLDMSGAQLRRNLVVCACNIPELVRLSGAHFSAVDFGSSKLGGLIADGLNAYNLVLDEGFEAAGPVTLDSATIGGSLRCTNGRFLGQPLALSCASASIGGNVLIASGFHAAGEVRIFRTTIGGEVNAAGAVISNEDLGLTLNRCKITGDVYLTKEFQCSGRVNLGGTSVGADLSFTGAKISGDVRLYRTRVGGTFFWCDVQEAEAKLNLTSATIETVNMDAQSWDQPSEILLEDFTYKAFTSLREGCEGAFWLTWLEKQPERYLSRDFRPQPYEQLAKVLQNMGHEDEARQVKIERRRRQARFNWQNPPAAASLFGRFLRYLGNVWEFLIGWLIDYGHTPGKAVLYLILIICVGAGVFQVAAYQGVMAPTSALIYSQAQGNGFIPKECTANWTKLAGACKTAVPAEYSEFSPLWYSMDVAIPLINLRQQEDWGPRVTHYDSGERHMLGWWVRLWEWIETLAGWLLSLLFVSAVGGIIRRE